jgi:predicted secreted protein
MRYDESANGRRVEIKVGEEFEIALPEVPTAGYHWTLLKRPAPVCELVDEKRDQPAGIGGSRLGHWRFSAVSQGTGEIELQYGRDWEKTGPVKKFQLTVVVRP